MYICTVTTMAITFLTIMAIASILMKIIASMDSASVDINV